LAVWLFLAIFVVVWSKVFPLAVCENKSVGRHYNADHHTVFAVVTLCVSPLWEKPGSVSVCVMLGTWCRTGLSDENFNEKPNNAKEARKRPNRLFKGQKQPKLCVRYGHSFVTKKRNLQGYQKYFLSN